MSERGLAQVASLVEPTRDSTGANAIITLSCDRSEVSS